MKEFELKLILDAFDADILTMDLLAASADDMARCDGDRHDSGRAVAYRDAGAEALKTRNFIAGLFNHAKA